MVDTNCQEDCIHNLTQQELQNLVFKLGSCEANEEYPRYKISYVSVDEVSQEDISHHEDQRQC